jgi:hypothetical protein
MSWPVELLAYGTSAPIRRITSFSAKFTDAPLAEGKFGTPEATKALSDRLT